MKTWLKVALTGKFDTVEKAIDSKLPSLVKINKDLGSTEVLKAVISMIVRTTEFFNVPKLTNMQIKMTAEMICKEYYYLNFADINLCFENAMKGKYGELYNRIDGQVIMIWLDKYTTERIELSEQRSYLKHSSLTAHEKERQYDGLIDRLKREGENINKIKLVPISSNQKFNKKKNKWEVKQ